ncbi:MAG TPA: HNH endonuclease [Aliidongia sp.]|uniref:HNH endonuclease n=1 Tax=Aliidongia sp. TaxID=1914230 RepID=UPI002DDCDBE6|nr:HNH endonuclease [Aliidongia sp.]HEV2675856.1 HNH endonuclease [Aliidongia sp.]
MSALARWPQEAAVRRQYQCLVLNADYQPLSTWPLSLIPGRDAVHALFRDRVAVVENWDAVFRSPTTEIAIPRVVALKQYAPVSSEPKFCRRSILLRDRYRCQYCGEPFEASELTFDHLVPRSKGGKTTWTNILTACLGCNGKKADKEANHSGRRGVIRKDGRLRPLKDPRRPTSAELLRAGLEFLPNDLREDFGSYLYWQAELQA